MSKTIRSMHAENEASDNCWDEIEQLRMCCLELMTKPGGIIGLLRDREAIARAASKDDLLEEAKILQADMEEYRHRLEVIYDRHKDRSGSATNPDDLTNALHVGELYTEWMNSFQTVVLPTLASISNNLLGGEEIMKPETVESGNDEEKPNDQ